MSEDEFRAFQEMQKLVDRAAWLKGISEIVGVLLLLALVCLIVRLLG